MLDRVHPTLTILTLSLAVITSSCQAPGLPEGEGRGVVAFDRDRPVDARTWNAPSLSVGDRFVYRSGSTHTMTVQVTAKSPEGYELTHQDGVVMALTSELAEISQSMPNQGTMVKSPPDVSYHWPLWVGKRWTCHYLRKVAGEDAQAYSISYHCDALETVKVRGGSFECLRIWRMTRNPTDQTSSEVATLLWYAPEIGYFVKQLRSGFVTELEQYSRGAQGDR